MESVVDGKFFERKKEREEREKREREKSINLFTRFEILKMMIFNGTRNFCLLPSSRSKESIFLSINYDFTRI